MPGKLHKFPAVDSGDTKLLTSTNGINFQKELCLKKSCPVILLRNLTGDLSNGTRGEVVDIGPDGPTVFFPSAHVTMLMGKYQSEGKMFLHIIIYYQFVL